MTAFDLSSPSLAIGSAAVAGFLSGILPTGLAEVAAVAIGVVEPPRLALPMIASFTVAHVSAKVPWYALGTVAERVRWERGRELVARARGLLARYPRYGLGILAISALLSLPPFHLAAIAAGIVRLPPGRFVLICLAGRAVRFGLLASVPAILRGWLA